MSPERTRAPVLGLGEVSNMLISKRTQGLYNLYAVAE